MAAVAAAANLQWRATNAPDTLTASERSMMQSYNTQQDAIRESLKQQQAFSQPRNDIASAGQSQAYQDLIQQYSTQRYGVVSTGPGGTSKWVQPDVYYVPENTQFSMDAAGIAAKVYLQGGRGAINPGVAEMALRQGMPAQYINLPAVNELGQRVNQSLPDYMAGKQVGGLDVIGIDRGYHTTDFGPAVISSSEMQKQTQFIQNVNKTPFISTPPVQAQSEIQTRAAAESRESPFAGFWNATMSPYIIAGEKQAAGTVGMQPTTFSGGQYINVTPTSISSRNITGSRVLASTPTITPNVTPATNLGLSAWLGEKALVSGRAAQDTRTGLSAAEARQQALINVESRPGYTADLGDRFTKAAVAATSSLRSMGYNVATPDQMTGRVLEAQRQSALETPGRTDERYYENQLEKWAQNMVEKSSAYHDVGMASGVPIAANPFEYQGDLAVEFLKGAPTKASERFSPVSGEMSQYLPGEGLQQYAWRDALKNEALPSAELGTSIGGVSFAGAVKYLGSKEGQYGPYGVLAGAPKYTATSPDRLIGGKVVAAEGRVLGTGPDVEFAGPAPFKSTPTPYQPVTREDVIGTAINSAMSAMVGSPTTKATYDIGRTIYGGIEQFASPVRQNILEGLALYTYKKGVDVEQEKLSASGYDTRIKGYESGVADYTSALGSYQQKVSSYETKLQEYESKRQTAGYDEATKMYSSLEREQAGILGLQSDLTSRKSALDIQYKSLASERGALESSQRQYSEKAAAFVGSAKYEELTFTPVAQPFISAGEGYGKYVTEPFSKFLSPLDYTVASPLKSAALGFVGVPGGLVSTVGMGISGGERAIGKPQNLPGLAAAGLVMQGEEIVKDPVRSAAALAGTYLFFEAGGAATTKVRGVTRTFGKDYLPIEPIGYEPNVGIPLAPRGTTRGQMLQSFEQRTLIPSPERSSLMEQVPYVPRDTGLPSDIAGGKYMWTAWTRSPESLIPVIQRVGGSREYTLAPYAPEGSELSGMYGSSVLQTYFSKIGGQAPESIGFTFGLKTPTAVRTRVVGFDFVPMSVSESVGVARAGGAATAEAYAQMESFVSANVQPGRAYFPMTKVEYEAVLQGRNVISVGQSRYYTKVGGFGESHFLGTRIPIVEQEAIARFGGPLPTGRNRPEISPSEYYYRAPPLISAESLAIAPQFSKGYAQYRQRPSYAGMVEQIPAYGQSSIRSASKPFSESYVKGSSATSTRAYGYSPASESYVSRMSSLKYPSAEKYASSYASSLYSPFSSPGYSSKTSSVSRLLSVPFLYTPAYASSVLKPSVPSVPRYPSSPLFPSSPPPPPPPLFPNLGDARSAAGAGGGGRLSLFAFKEILPVKTGKQVIGGLSGINLGRGAKRLKRLKLI